jgi:hypothetical protein
LLVVVPVGVSVPFAAVVVVAVVDGGFFGNGGSGSTDDVDVAVVDTPEGFTVLLAKDSELPFEGTHLHRYSPSPVAVHLQSRFAGNCA